MFDKTNTYAYFDLIELGLLPENWADEILEVAINDSYMIHLDGKSSTSREPENTSGTDVFVVEGVTIYEKLQWLYQLYAGRLLELANQHFNNEYIIDSNIVSGVNINFLKGKNSRYEWHVDSNPLTGLLFVTTHILGDGGELIFNLKGKHINVYPKSGIFILFDARKIPHAVQPLIRANYRISIPMNFFIKGERKNRPSDLDDYIYQNQDNEL